MDFKALRAFVRTVERGSVTGAARDLSISQPAVTKHLRNLERDVNARLLERNSRSVRPTSHGLALYEASRGAFAMLDAAMEGVRRDMGEIEGQLRIFAPSCIGAGPIHDIVMAFQDLHPAVSVDLVLDVRHVDLIHENFDLAVHYDRPESQDTVIRRLGSVRRILVASPGYLEDAGPIETPEQFSAVGIVTTTRVLSPRDTLALVKGGETLQLPVHPALRTNNAEVFLNSLLGGRGPGPVQQILVLDELAEGRLVRILPDYEVRPTEAYLAYPSSKFMRPVVRAFIDFLVPQLQAIEGID
jgi:DNA-binding transcriptional LysR family regulator